MAQLNQNYLDNLIKDLHRAEDEIFSPNNNSNKYNDDKLVKLNQLKAKQISTIKYNAQKLKEIMEKIEYQINNPKIKVVGI